VKLWYDDFSPSEEWAKLYHKQYDLAIDFIGKLETVYGPVARPAKKVKATPTKKTGLKLSIKKQDDEPSVDVFPQEEAPIEKKIIKPISTSSKKIVFKGKSDDDNAPVKKKIVIKKK
jgi:hypothetical protein